MSIDHAPAVAHRFQNCTDPDCSELLCRHYRAGLTAGSEFIRAGAKGFARVRDVAMESDGDFPDP